MDFLFYLRRKLEPVVNRLGLRRVAQIVFRPLLRLRYGRSGLALVRQNGRQWKYHVEVALRAEFAEYDTVLWLRDVIQPGNCILDIGANVGQMTLEAAELTGSNGLVVAVEPAPGNVRLLSEHVQANGMADRVKIVAAACGATHGSETTLIVYGDRSDEIGNGHNCVGLRNHEKTTTFVVPMVSVDGLCASKNFKPTVLKIDVEGAELEVLRGCVQTLLSCRPKVRVAFHPFAFSDPIETTSMIRMLFDECDYETPAPGRCGSYELMEYSCTPRQP